MPSWCQSWCQFDSQILAELLTIDQVIVVQPADHGVASLDRLLL